MQQNLQSQIDIKNEALHNLKLVLKYKAKILKDYHDELENNVQYQNILKESINLEQIESKKKILEQELQYKIFVHSQLNIQLAPELQIMLELDNEHNNLVKTINQLKLCSPQYKVSGN